MDEPMLFQCTARESGGTQCEVLLTSSDEQHAHWISDETIRGSLRRPIYTHIGINSFEVYLADVPF